MRETNKNVIISILIIIIAVIAFIAFRNNPSSNSINEGRGNNTDENIATESSIEGCYVASIARDVYTLTIASEDEGRVTGTLEYDNFEKDSSSGIFMGTYDGEILLGDYSFHSEGMFSVSQVVFKKTPEGFMQGFGPTEVEGNRSRLIDPQNASFDPNLNYFLKQECAAHTQNDGII